MKAILEFSLPEDKDYFESACHAMDYKIALSDIWSELRSLAKYSDLSQFKTPSDLLEYMRVRYCEILKENEINVD